MLEIIKVQKRSDILQQFSQFNAKTQSWLVSDLRTKLEIQNRLIERDQFFVDTSILRATDLWRLLYRRQYPKKKIIERGWARIILSNFLRQNISDLKLNQASASTILEMIEFFLPLLSHPEGEERFRDWLENHLNIKDRWAEWYILTKLCFQYLYEEKDFVLPSWFSSLLIQQSSPQAIVTDHWQRTLWVDLGGQILWSEAELLKILSRQIEIKVFVVESEWQNDFKYKMRPYAHLESHATKKSKLPSSDLFHNKIIQVKKFSGELAEIRHCVSVVRDWVNQGILPSTIGIISPDIENYWPVLQCFLDQEGIPTNKEVTTKLSSLPSVQQWMAGNRLLLKEVRSVDLEMHFYKSQNLNYEEFKSLFANILGSEDLKKHSQMKELYLKPLSLSTAPNRDEWIVFISRLWSAEDDTKPLALILDEIYHHGYSDTRLPRHDWLEHLESLVVRLEISLKSANPNGVHLASLMAAPSFKMRKRIFIGLSEDSLKQSSSQFLSHFEVEKLFSDLGFFLENHDLSSKEFELRMLAETDSEEDVFTFGIVTLSGKMQAPSSFWLKLNIDEAQVMAPLSTRWDDIQHANSDFYLNSLRGFSDEEVKRLKARIEMDQNPEQFEKFISAEKPSLSPSRVETYLDCPFKFAVQAIFYLKDLPEVDLHIDPRIFGSFVHDLFEILSSNKKNYDLSTFEIENTVQNIYENKFKKIFHQELWPAYKNRFLLIAQRFIEFEKNWFIRFPKTLTVDREKSWSYQVWQEEGVLKSQKMDKKAHDKSSSRFFMSGKIDRVDSDGARHLVVIDYKSGSSSAENYINWKDNNKLQLLFYIWALENDVMEKNEVVGAFYYVFKNMERHRGLGLREGSSELFSMAERAGAWADLPTKKSLIEDLEKTLIEVMSHIDEGLFPPRPREEEICIECHWRQMCRAPHLT